MDKLAKILHQVEDKSIYGSSTEFTNNDCFIGLEIEVEGLSLNHFTNRSTIDHFFWSIDHDGSLRNGAELKFRQPFKGINIINALHDMDNSFNLIKKAYNLTPSLSDRTSIHVHMDARDLNKEQIDQFIYLYLLLESVIFNYVGSYRIKNNYCRPLLGSNFTTIMREFSEREGGSYVDFIREYTDKYSALNVKALSSFGSMEFRHHPGTVDTNRICNWIDIITSIKKFIKDGGTIYDLVELDYEIALSTIFSDKNIELLHTGLSKNLYLSNKYAVIEALNDTILRKNTSNILRKNSKANLENRLIQKYKEKGVE